jgi:hypothetical protein
VTYIRLDDDHPTHPDIADLTDAEYRDWVALLCAASRHRSDGLLSDGQIAKIVRSKKVHEALIRKGRLHRENGGWKLHGYLRKQRSRAQIEAASEAGRNAARMRFASESHANGNADRSTEWMP